MKPTPIQAKWRALRGQLRPVIEQLPPHARKDVLENFRRMFYSGAVALHALYQDAVDGIPPDQAGFAEATAKMWSLQQAVNAELSEFVDQMQVERQEQLRRN